MEQIRDKPHEISSQALATGNEQHCDDNEPGSGCYREAEQDLPQCDLLSGLPTCAAQASSRNLPAKAQLAAHPLHADSVSTFKPLATLVWRKVICLTDGFSADGRRVAGGLRAAALGGTARNGT
jgi:hypothetical protein